MRVMLLCAFAVFLLLIPSAGSEDMRIADSKRMETGGHAILMEHYTATWCPSCAEVDPLVSDFMAQHSERVYRVALHPNDHDPFGTPATQHRIFMKEGVAEAQLPTIWFDGRNDIEGFVTYGELSSALSSAEIGREHGYEIGMDWSTWENGIHEKFQRVHILFDFENRENTTLTLFRTETLNHDSEIASNGIVTHHDVVTAMFTVELNGNPLLEYPNEDTAEIWHQSYSTYTNSTDFNSVIGFDLYGDADSFIAVIESEGEVLAALGLTDVVQHSTNEEKSANSAIVILASALVFSTLLLYRRGS